MVGVVTKSQRVAFYARHLVDELAPQFLFRNRLHDEVTRLPKSLWPDIASRVHYCNRLDENAPLSQSGTTIGTLPRGKSYYYFDTMEIARRYPRDLRINVVFGDVTFVPKQRSIVKSRPVAGDNRNSIMLRLDQLRHFRFVDDDAPFAGKQAKAVWRGWAREDHPARSSLVKSWHENPHCDIAHVGGTLDGIARGSFMSAADQLRFRYIVSIEGNDVATNLKWLMSSNSIALMPKPSFETWFMEGSLIAGKHYGELLPDTSNLLDVINAFEGDPQSASEMIRAARAYTDRFRDPVVERAIGLLVLYKYFRLTDQIKPEPQFDEILAAAPPYPLQV